MNATIEISDQTLEKLKNLAEPLVDTPDTVVNRLIDFWRSENTSSSSGESLRRYVPDDTPALTHTKLRTAVVDGEHLVRPNWQGLARNLLERAFKRAGSFEGLRRMTDARIFDGIKLDEGYSPVGDMGFSFQGVDAHEAFRLAFGLARKLRVPLSITFEWRNKEGAVHPGEVGSCEWTP